MGIFDNWIHEIEIAWDPEIFIGQFLGFLIIVFVLVKYVVPAVKKMMTARQETIRKQLEDSADASRRLADATAAHDRAVVEAEAESKALREEAVRDAQFIESDFAAKAEDEVARIQKSSGAQVGLHRSGLLRRLRGEVGALAVGGAADIVRNHLADPAAQATTVDSTIAELEAMAGSQPESVVPASAELVGVRSLGAGSRESARAVSNTFEQEKAGLDTDGLFTVADDLVSVVGFLLDNPILLKKVAEPVDNTAGKDGLARSLFEGRISPAALAIVVTAAKGQWSHSSDLVTVLRREAALVVLTAAERDGVLEQTEEELFRVGRVLAGSPELTTHLDESAHSRTARVGLLKSVFGDKVNTYTWYLVSHAQATLRGHSIESVIDRLAELAAARRGESVARVATAVNLTDAQHQRLKTVLGSIFGRPMSLQVETEPELLGGLRITVGDEIIDAGIASRLNEAADTLPK